MIGNILALGLVVTAATQLRAGGSPVGPGELLLLAWLGLAFLQQVLRPAAPVNPAFQRVTMFWLVMVLFQCVGMLVGLALEPFHDYVGILRDAAAYALVLALSLMMALELADPVRRSQVVWGMLIIGSASVLLQIGNGFGAIPVPGMQPWYYERFKGWAENPNQLGFFALVITILGVHLADVARDARESALALAFTVPPFLAGLMSRSDSFVIGLMLSGSLFITLKCVAWVQDTNMAPTLRGAAVVLGLLSLPVTAVAVIPFAAAAIEQIEQSSEKIYNDNDQGETRLHLWAESLEKGADSGLIGFGPGPHLTSKSYKRPPPNKFEAHNTLFDLFTQGGFLAVAAFVWISASAMLGVGRAGLPALAGLVAGLLVFSMFHFVLRHPIFWFAIVLCLLEAARASGRLNRPAPC